MFVAAYSKATGKKLPYLVPEHHLNHPVLGRGLSRLPSATRASRRKAAEADPVPPTTETPASGDNQKEE